MMEQHALDQEAVKQAAIWLPIHQLGMKQFQGATESTGIVKRPAKQQQVRLGIMM